MRSHIAQLAHGPVRYLDNGHGKLLLLLHGFPLNAEQWLPQVSRPPVGFRVIAPDLRGFRGAGSPLSVAQSERAVASEPAARSGDRGVPASDAVGAPAGVKPPGQITIDDYAADALALMSHLDIDRAIVGGLSMGGYVALAIARRAPARLTGLILANTRAGADSVEGRAARDRMIDLVRREGVHAVARDMLPKLLGHTTERDQPDLIEAVRGLIEANDADGLAAAIHAMKTRPDSTPMLASIACPTLVITSAEDALINVSEGEAMARVIPHSQLVVLPNAGHLSNLESPDEFSRALQLAREWT